MNTVRSQNKRLHVLSQTEKRIYVAVAGTIQVPVSILNRKLGLKTVVQPIGRQVAQAAHVVSKLRHSVQFDSTRNHDFQPITTIVLQARDSAEMGHVHQLATKRKLNPIMFSDTNEQYGSGEFPTAIAIYASKKQIEGILDYLPLWGTQ